MFFFLLFKFDSVYSDHIFLFSTNKTSRVFFFNVTDQPDCEFSKQIQKYAMSFTIPGRLWLSYFMSITFFAPLSFAIFLYDSIYVGRKRHNKRPSITSTEYTLTTSLVCTKLFYTARFSNTPKLSSQSVFVQRYVSWKISFIHISFFVVHARNRLLIFG